MKNASFETALTDAQWEYLKPMLPKPRQFGRPPTDRRVVLNAIRQVPKGGRPWRLLPKNFPPWKTVCHVFRAWSRDDTWAVLKDALRGCVRVDEGRDRQPSAAIQDSQSVRPDGPGGPAGYDAGKQIQGRKRHLPVDALGLGLGVIVDPGGLSGAGRGATGAPPSRRLVQTVAQALGGRRLCRRSLRPVGA